MPRLFLLIAFWLLASCEMWRPVRGGVEQLALMKPSWPCQSSTIQSWELEPVGREFTERFIVISECSEYRWQWVLLDSLGMQVVAVDANERGSQFAYNAPSQLRSWVELIYGVWVLSIAPDYDSPTPLAGKLEVASRSNRRELFDSGILRAQVSFAELGSMVAETERARFKIHTKPL